MESVEEIWNKSETRETSVKVTNREQRQRDKRQRGTEKGIKRMNKQETDREVVIEEMDTIESTDRRKEILKAE
jgi:hypothetical protein